MPIGVLNAEQVRALIIGADPPVLKCDREIREAPEASSIDAPLGDRYYKMPGSFRPGAKYAVADIIRRLGAREQEIPPEGATLDRGGSYLIRLMWDIKLPKNICVRATAKSSIGRLDALVRLIADEEPEFDRIRVKGAGRLYVEVAPLTFPLLVRPGKSLSQLRFMKGDEDVCTVPVRELTEFEDEPVLVGSGGRELELRTSEGDSRGVLLSLDTTPDEEVGFIGFVAKNDVVEPIDPWLRNDDRYDPHEFWEPVRPDARDKHLVCIERDRFYIFRSVERFRIPSHLAVECQAYSEGMGDIRIHYAGFAHPWFGYDRTEGTPLIFEVRGHSVDTFLRHGDALAKVYFRRMSERAHEPDHSSYNAQELKLSACFSPWS
jgi:dCTP deaminase